ncbi:flagellar export chaperone FlgN [Neomoorella thermoacetica]|uniref:flagellar export chaperone FlgN n=1 Tax=Neomoorella thermoacetica TaxID=1525 RepID=UPI0008FB8BCE|nr:flagellar export chaperone FlgN [Moorella thermoacetica]OIQ55625.1 FlgN protein [Moorella thermoacetica]
MTDANRELLLAKKRLWQEIYAITLAQSRLLTPDKSEELLESLTRREGCMKALEDLKSRDLAAGVAGLAGATSGLAFSHEREGGAGSEEDEQDLEELQAAIRQLASQVQEVDARNRKTLAANFACLKQKLENFRASKGALMAYHERRGAGRGFFVDANR